MARRFTELEIGITKEQKATLREIVYIRVVSVSQLAREAFDMYIKKIGNKFKKEE